MTKTPPEETWIATRQAGEGVEPARREDAREILEMLDTVLDEQAAWLRRWHRAVLCAAPTVPGTRSRRFETWLETSVGRGLLDQPVFSRLRSDYMEMHDRGERLACRAADGERLSARDYDAFMDRVQSFAETARRIRDAFQHAVYDLDPLTGVRSRRSMIAELGRERERAIRTGNPVYVALCDIDGFKAVNDEHGHLTGDSVLLAVAGRLIANLRPYDAVYRFGGDEFLLAFTETDGDQAVGISDRLRASIAATAVRAGEDVVLSVTASFGIAALDHSAPVEASIRRADEALYRAKRDGRDRVVLWTGEPRGGEGRHG